MYVAVFTGIVLGIAVAMLVRDGWRVMWIELVLLVSLVCSLFVMILTYNYRFGRVARGLVTKELENIAAASHQTPAKDRESGDNR